MTQQDLTPRQLNCNAQLDALCDRGAIGGHLYAYLRSQVERGNKADLRTIDIAARNCLRRSGNERRTA